MSGLVAVIAIGVVVGLFLALVAGFSVLFSEMRDAEREAHERELRAWRYGGSLSWNDETPASLDGGRGFDATRSRKG